MHEDQNSESVALLRPERDHYVLSGVPVCDAFTDRFGRWIDSFECPPVGDEPVFCCGESDAPYCCTARDLNPLFFRGPTLPLLFVVVIGTSVAFLLILITALRMCTARRRIPMTPQPAALYRLQSTSACSGVANMYSCSYESLSRDEARRTPQLLRFSRTDMPSGSAVDYSYKMSGVQTMPRSFGTQRDRSSRVSFVDPSRATVTDAGDLEMPAGGHVARISPYAHCTLPRQSAVATAGTAGSFPRSPAAGGCADDVQVAAGVRPGTTLPLTEYLPTQDDGMCRSTKF